MISSIVFVSSDKHSNTLLTSFNLTNFMQNSSCYYLARSGTNPISVKKLSSFNVSPFSRIFTNISQSIRIFAGWIGYRTVYWLCGHSIFIRCWNIRFDWPSNCFLFSIYNIDLFTEIITQVVIHETLLYDQRKIHAMYWFWFLAFSGKLFKYLFIYSCYNILSIIINFDYLSLIFASHMAKFVSITV